MANQTYKRFKVYIGDDASPEDPKELIEEYREKININYKRFETNLGGISLTQQWDRCIDLSRDEEWIMILGDDDYFAPNVIEAFYDNSSKFLGRANLVRFARRNIVSNQDINEDIQYNPIWESAADSYYRRITGQTTSTLSEYAFTRKAYQRFGFYNYPLAWQSDNRAWIEFSQDKPIYSINDAVVSVIRSPESISGSKQFDVEKRTANLSFYKYLITEKLIMFNSVQAIRVLHKYENEINHEEKVTLREYLFLLPYYLKNYDARSFKNYCKKMTKSIRGLK